MKTFIEYCLVAVYSIGPNRHMHVLNHVLVSLLSTSLANGIMAHITYVFQSLS